MVVRRKLIFLILFMLLLPMLYNGRSTAIGLSTTLYVDQDLPENCLDNTYAIDSRDCGGNDGDGYTTIAEAVANANAGNNIHIRAGAYNANGISIPFNGEMTLIQAQPGEAVTITNASPGIPTFALTADASNITFKNLNLVGTQSLLLTGWSSYAPNIWQTSYNAHAITELLFDANQGTLVNDLQAMDAPFEWFHENKETLYVYAEGNPEDLYNDPGIIVIDDYQGIGIGRASSGTGLIVIDNLTFINFSHGGVKGGYRWWVKNSTFDQIGTDFHDHHIYSTGRHSDGGETIIEHNYFGYTTGAAVHLYADPSYHIVRYNLFNGLDGEKRAFWGVLLAGEQHQIYNNTFYGAIHGLTFFREGSHDNKVINNLFYGNLQDLSIDHEGVVNSFPGNLTSSSNYLGSDTPCSGCVDQTAQGGADYSLLDDPPNIVSTINPFQTATVDSWKAFKLQPSCLCIDAGQDLGSGQDMIFHPFADNWPATTASQNQFGAGWEIGAFAHFAATDYFFLPVILNLFN